ncbi:hypothetical protein Sfulv_21090 [Streptomyces fulvorobeus]|uniref:Uncharacterized protein n=1 Tax=Streptomyces fulvorobeus TaxID=284028 RepID=A0A7J0C4G9_9ACTN|nr:hypothetical protein Sfulv_21090 [Streptomyces fulvorobeus]
MPVAGDGVGVDLPVVEGEEPGGEAVLRLPVVAADRVAALAQRGRGQQALVGELGEALADQQPVGGGPAPGERWATLSVRAGIRRDLRSWPGTVRGCTR